MHICRQKHSDAYSDGSSQDDRIRPNDNLKEASFKAWMDVDRNWPSDLKTIPTVAPSINTDTVGNITDLLDGMVTYGTRGAIEELLTPVSDITRDASAVIFTIGNGRNCISMSGDVWELRLRTDSIERCTISGNASRTVTDAPCTRKTYLFF